jgi:peptide/nickel transport system permease protein
LHPVITTVLQRLGLGLLTLFLVSIIIFSSIAFLPGDFGEFVLGQNALPETVAAFRRELGLDEPTWLRYIKWVTAVLQGDLGTSFSGRASSGANESRTVVELIAPRLWNTLFLAGVTAIVAVPLSLFLGITAALKRNSLYDRSVNAVTLTTISFPEFFIAYLLIVFLAGYFPTLSTVNSGTEFAERLYKIALPAMTMTLVIVAHMMRMTRVAKRMGADCNRDCIQPGLPCRWCGGCGSGVCLSGHWTIDGGFRERP